MKVANCGIHAGADGTWAIFSGSPMRPGCEWWCGDAAGWVSPDSSYWHMVPDCWEQSFATPQAALKKLREVCK